MSRDIDARVALLPCPFCGNSASTYPTLTAEKETVYRTSCNSCDCGTDWRFEAEKTVVKWNRRVAVGVKEPNRG